jgi:hypothetical protein
MELFCKNNKLVRDKDKSELSDQAALLRRNLSAKLDGPFKKGISIW